MRGKAQSEVVLEIKTIINLSVPHLSKSIMLSSKLQCCGFNINITYTVPGRTEIINSEVYVCLFVNMFSPDDHVQT